MFFNFDTLSVFKLEENKSALDQISDQFHHFDRKFVFAIGFSCFQNRDMRLAQQCMTEATLISMLVFIAREYLSKQKSCEKRHIAQSFLGTGTAYSRNPISVRS